VETSYPNQQAPPNLDEFFGSNRRGPTPRKCIVCGRPSVVRVTVAIKEILRQTNERKTSGDGRVRQITRSFCLEHGTDLYQEIVARME